MTEFEKVYFYTPLIGIPISLVWIAATFLYLRWLEKRTFGEHRAPNITCCTKPPTGDP